MAIVIALGVVALCLRLVWPAPIPSATHELPLAAALGEHALCLSESSTTDPGASPHDPVPPLPADHAGHDCLACCAAGATGGGILPRGIATRVAFATAPVANALQAPPRALPGWRIRPSEPRAPPVLG
jgi:hypothetical protein